MNSSQEEVSQQELGIKKVPLSERGLEKFSGFKDREYYPNLEDLAYVLATQQQEYSQVMRRAMKKSRVKEGILNLTKGNEIDKTNDLVLDAKDKIDVLYEKNAKMKSKKLKVKQLLKRLSHDVNNYFSIVEHRKRVLEEGEPFWVAFNPPDHDKSEYFVRAFNQFGEDSLISSKDGIEDNIMVLAYSENQENYSAALQIADPILDCPEYTYFGEPCFPDDPNPDPNPITYEKGLNLTSIRTKNIHDGVFDGDLELKFRIEQPAFSGYVNLPVLGSTYFNLSLNTLLLADKNHDAGHWYLTISGMKFRNSNKTTYINARRRANERYLFADLPIVGKIYYDEFKIFIEEDDPIFDEMILDGLSFNLSTYSFGVVNNVLNDKVWLQLDYKDYPANSF